MMPTRLSRSFQMLATFVGHTVSRLAHGLRTRLGPRRALMAATYALLLVSCDSPFAPDDQTVARLEVSPLALSMTVGDARTITVRVLDDAGKALDSRQTFWSSQNPAVATVSPAGLVTGISQGSTQIAVSAGGKSAIVPVTVNARPVSLVRVTPSTAAIFAGGAQQLTAEALDAGGATVTGRPVIWSTANAAIATVTSTGVVTGLVAGTVNISATIDGVAGASVVTVQPVPIASILLTPPTSSLIVGQSLQLAATPRDSNGTALAARALSWTSNSPTVASVSSTGLVTALSAGTATITAAAEGKSATSRITVSLVPVDTVSVTPRTTTLAAGQVQQLTARVVDATGTVLPGRTITWDTDQPTIATVSSSGLVTALTNGRATISASTGGKSGTATVNVTPVPVASLSISPGSGTLQVGGTLQLSATARDASNNILPGRIITWISGAPSVATVTQGGLVTAVGTGSALIFAASEGIATSISITVSSFGVADVRVTPTSGTVQQGRTLQLTAEALDANGNVIVGRTAIWNSVSPSIASVSSTGVVTGISTGTTNVSATIDGVIGLSTITVAATAVARVSIVPSNPTMTVGANLTMTALLFDATGTALSTAGRTITWSSSNPSVLTVTPTGVVTAVASGSALLSVRADTANASTTVTVTNIPVASVTLAPPTASLQLGQSVAVTATARDGSGNVLTGRPVTWSSSNVAVATINSSATGNANTITAVGTGSATIGATIGGVQGVSTINVSSVPIATITVAPSPATVVERQSVQLTATAFDASNNVLSGRTLVWSSSNNAIASVSQSGVVTAVVPGSVTISASAPGQGVGGSNPTPGTSAVTVTFAPVASVVSSPSTATISVGQTTNLTATLFDGAAVPQTLTTSGRTVSWRSLNTSIATVSASGVVTGVATSATPVGIEVSASSPGQGTPALDTSFVSVTNIPVDRVVITPGPSATVHVGGTYARTFTAQAFDASNNPLTGRPILWTSDALGVATVTSTGGLVTGIAVGNADITATISGVSASTAVTVDLVPIGSASTVALSAAQADSVVPGNTRTFTATPRDSAGNVISGAALGGRTPAWSLASGATFASIAPSGASATVTPNSPGSVTVEADYGTAKPTAGLRILTPVNNILLTVAADSFFVGASTALVATARDASGSTINGRTINLTSSAPGTASIGTGTGTGSINTTLAGVAAPGGRAQVTISANVPLDGQSNSTTVRVLAPVATITVSAPADSIFVNGNVQATAVLKDGSGNTLTGRPIAWSTGNALIATAAQSGVITGVAAGSTPIHADAEGKQGSKTLLVQEPVSSVSISAPDSSIFVSQSLSTTVTLLDRLNNTLTGRLITYTSSQPSVATINASGAISTVGPGTTTITATSEGKSASFTLTTALIPVATVTVSASPPPNVYPGPNSRFGATVVARDSVNGVLSLANRTIAWSSNAPTVVSVTPGTTPGTATLTALSVGSAVITALVDGVAPMAPISITVQKVPVASVSISPTSASLQVASTQQFTATPRDSTGAALAGRTIVFSSSNAKATVDPVTGLATAADSGAVNIIATATGEGFGGSSPSAQAALTISLAPIARVVISPTSATVAVGANATLTLDVQNAANIGLAGRACTITSSRPNALTVSPGSAVTNSAGQIMITITGVAVMPGADPVVSATCEGVASNNVTVVVQ